VNSAFSQHAIKQYHVLQEQMAATLCLEISKDPSDFFSLVRLTAGRIVAAVTYGIRVESAQDEYISMAEKTLRLIGKATVPGAYLCDLIPICMSLYPRDHFRRNSSST
jgi:hypothetical protein